MYKLKHTNKKDGHQLTKLSNKLCPNLLTIVFPFTQTLMDTVFLCSPFFSRCMYPVDKTTSNGGVTLRNKYPNYWIRWVRFDQLLLNILFYTFWKMSNTDMQFFNHCILYTFWFSLNCYDINCTIYNSQSDQSIRPAVHVCKNGKQHTKFCFLCFRNMLVDYLNYLNRHKPWSWKSIKLNYGNICIY